MAPFLDAAGFVLMLLGGAHVGIALTREKWLRFWAGAATFGVGQMAVLIAHHLA